MWLQFAVIILFNFTVNGFELFNVDEMDATINVFMQWYMKNASCVILLAQESNFIELILQNNQQIGEHSFQVFTDVSQMDFHTETSKGYFIISASAEFVIETLKRFANYSMKASTHFLVLLNTDGDCTEIFQQSNAVKLKFLLLIRPINRVYKVLLFEQYKNTTFVYDIFDYDRILTEFFEKDYSGHTLKATLFHNPPTATKIDHHITGQDPLICKTIADKLNFTIKFHEPFDNNFYGAREEDGSMSGNIRELYTELADIGCNQVFLKNYNAPDLVFTSTIFRDELCVVVPQATLKPCWSELLTTFSTSSWIVIDSILFIAFVSLVVMRRVKWFLNGTTGSGRVGHGLYKSTFFDVLQMVLNVTQRTLYVLSSEKIYLGSMLFFALLFSASFQASLLRVIRADHHYPNIDTMEDLDKSTPTITTASPSLMDTFDGFDRSVYQSLHKKLKLIKKLERNRAAYLATKSRVEFMHVTDVNASTHMVRECAQNYFLAYMVHRDAYFLSDFNQALDAIFEGGLTLKWYGDFMHNMTLKNIYGYGGLKAEDDEARNSFVTLRDLSGGLYALMLGQLAGSIAFILEIYGVI